MELSALLTDLIARDGSDLHLAVGQPPTFRVGGELTRRDGPALDAAQMDALVGRYLTDGALEADVSLRQDEATFRCHVFRERGRPGAAIRVIPSKVPTLDELFAGQEGVNAVLRSLTQRLRGLVLITGPIGSGKATTCAAMLEEINQTRAERIVTVESPIEYVLQSKRSLITQRGVGQDVPSFEDGARAAWQEDADVILIGDLHSMEAVQLALSLAETGHLVFAKLHLESASEAVQRLIEAFPEPREGVRRMLARTLLAVVAQKLLPRVERGRVPAIELMMATPRVRQMIAEGKVDALDLVVEAGHDQGMRSMDDAVLALHRAGAISRETAWHALQDRDRLSTSSPESQ